MFMCVRIADWLSADWTVHVCEDADWLSADWTVHVCEDADWLSADWTVHVCEDADWLSADWTVHVCEDADWLSADWTVHVCEDADWLSADGVLVFSGCRTFYQEPWKEPKLSDLQTHLWFRPLLWLVRLSVTQLLNLLWTSLIKKQIKKTATVKLTRVFWTRV